MKRARTRTTRSAAAPALVALLAALAGCGGSQGGGMMGSSGRMMSSPRSGMMGGTTTPPTPTGAGGRALFLASGCGGCHTLAAAGATGTAGPNLDDVRPTYALVLRRATEGGSGMPAFGRSLTPAQLRAIARYVSGSAR